MAPVPKPTPKQRFLAWLPFLGLALVLHVALLWWPVVRDRAAAPTEAAVEITLVTPPAPPEPLPEPEPQPVEPPEPEALPEPEPEPEPEAIAETPPPAEPTPDQPPEPKPVEDPAPPSAMTIIDSIADTDIDPEDNTPRPIGRATESELVERMRRPLLAMVENDFDGVYLDGSSELLDRWQSQDGTYNVVVRGKDGKAYCGRQAPADPFRPWLQMPIMYHPCAGGGKRK